MFSIIKKHFWLQVIIVALIGILIELCWFNINYIRMSLKDLPKNIVYNMGDAELYNWEKIDEGYISGPDPMIVIPNVNFYVENIRIKTTPILEVSDGAIFYTNDEAPVFGSGEILYIVEPLSKKNIFSLKNNVYDVRIDIGEAPGTIVEDVEVVLNENKLDFRFTRVIIIILVYVIGSYLLSLQRPRKYDI